MLEVMRLRRLRNLFFCLASADLAYRTLPANVPYSRAYVRKSLGIA